MGEQEKEKKAQGGAPTATGSVDTDTFGPIDTEKDNPDARAGGAAGSRKRKEIDTSGGTERAQFGEKTTGGLVPDADKGSRTEDDEDLDATSGAGGTTAGGGKSRVPT